MRRRVDADRVRALARALGQAAGDDMKLYLALLFRYPAIDPAGFRARVERALG